MSSKTLFTAFLTAIIMALVMAPAAVQGRETTWLRLFHGLNCTEVYMDIEVWAETCASWIPQGWTSFMVLRRNFLRKQYILMYDLNNCASHVSVCADNQYAPRCINTGLPANAIGSWATNCTFFPIALYTLFVCPGRSRGSRGSREKEDHPQIRQFTDIYF